MKPLMFLLLVSLFTTAWGQDFLTKDQLDKKALKYFDQAYQHVNRQEWNQAISCLDQLLERRPNAIDALLFRAGIQHDNGRFAEAEKDFEAAHLLSMEYAPISIYQLAVTEFKQEKYSESVEHFDAYLRMPSLDKVRKKRAEDFLAKATIAARIKSHPVPFEPQSLGEQINTKGKEYLPSFTADGQLLVYTVNYDGQEDFYFSTRDSMGQWTQGMPFDAINTRSNEGAQSIAANGKTLVYAGCHRKDGLGSCDLYYNEYTNGEWSEAYHPDAPFNTRYWESQPCLSANGKWLFFASDRPGGFGGNDIWVSGRKTDGKWGKPINLGTPINTAGNEESPFIHPDGQTLYFMSDGHPGLGAYDLFLSRLEGGQYTEPENLGYPINTAASEGALVVSFDGKTAYYTTDKKSVAGQKQDFDIYQFPLYEDARPQPVTYIKGKVIDHNTKLPIPSAIITIKQDVNQAPLTIKADKDGLFMVVLAAGKNYQLNTSAKDYLFFSERFEFKDANNIEAPFDLNIPLYPIQNRLTIGQEIVLRNVLFETNSDALLEESTQELNRLIELLNQNPEIHIQINGHTDNVGSEEDNQILSEKRAAAVVDFLVSAGISEDRLQSKGFGESRPIVDNNTAEGRAKNRRTSFKVIEKK